MELCITDQFLEGKRGCSKDVYYLNTFNFFEQKLELSSCCKQYIRAFMNNFSTECPHFDVCSGCCERDIYNPPIWEEIKTYIKNIDPSIQPDLIYGPFVGSRLKAKLAIQKVNSEIHIGLYKENSHDIVDIPSCLVHHLSINKAASIVKEAIEKFSIPVYCEKTRKGLIRYLQFFVQKKSGKVQLAIVMNIKDISEVNNYSQFFDYLYSEGKLFHSIWVNLNDNNTNVIFSNDWDHIKGEKFFWQKIEKIDFLFHPMSFCQSNLDLFEKLIENLEKERFVFSEKKENILELYAGIGAIGLNLAHKSNSITLVEKNPFSKIFFDLIEQKEGLKNIKYLCQGAEEADQLIDQNEIIIVDPPRKGLDFSLLERICSKDNGKLIYISCFFKSYRRDCDKILSSGWKLKIVKGYLFFPGTNQVELLSIFEKKSG